MIAHRLAKPQHKHTRKSFGGTISERSIAVLLKRAHANERSADTCAATDAAGSRTFVVALRMFALCHVWTYMDPARLQQVDGIRFNGHNC